MNFEGVGSLGRSSKRSLELLAEHISDDPGVERLGGDWDLHFETGGGSDGQSAEKGAVAVAIAAALAARGRKLDVAVVGRSVLRHDFGSKRMSEGVKGEIRIGFVARDRSKLVVRQQAIWYQRC